MWKPVPHTISTTIDQVEHPRMEKMPIQWTPSTYASIILTPMLLSKLDHAQNVPLFHALQNFGKIWIVLIRYSPMTTRAASFPAPWFWFFKLYYTVRIWQVLDSMIVQLGRPAVSAVLNDGSGQIHYSVLNWPLQCPCASTLNLVCCISSQSFNVQSRRQVARLVFYFLFFMGIGRNTLPDCFTVYILIYDLS